MNRPDSNIAAAEATKRSAIIARSSSPRWQLHRAGVALLAATVFLAYAAISCRTVNRVSVKLPEVPGAKYIG